MRLRLTVYERDGSLYDIIDEDDDARGQLRQARRLLDSAIVPSHPTAGMRFALERVEN